MKIYHYSDSNGEFVGTSQAKPDPMGDGYLIPANATTEQPPEPGPNQAACFDGFEWYGEYDYRGWTGYDAEGNEQKIDKLGEKPAADWTTEPPVLPEPVPTVVSMRKARLALLQSGYLEQVETAISGMSKAAQIEWETAGTVERGNSICQAMIDILQLDSQQTDDLFILAAGL